MTEPSIADRFIESMAALNALDRLTDIDRPMRHQVRMIKAQARHMLDSAIRHAWELAIVAEGMARDAEKAIKEASESNKGE